MFLFDPPQHVLLGCHPPTAGPAVLDDVLLSMHGVDDNEAKCCLSTDHVAVEKEMLDDVLLPIDEDIWFSM